MGRELSLAAKSASRDPLANERVNGTPIIERKLISAAGSAIGRTLRLKESETENALGDSAKIQRDRNMNAAGAKKTASISVPITANGEKLTESVFKN